MNKEVESVLKTLKNGDLIEFQLYGGRPFAATIANYEFGPTPQEIMLLQKLGTTEQFSIKIEDIETISKPVVTPR